MMKPKKIYVIAIILILQSCNRMEVTERFESGELKEHCEFKGNLKDGKCKGYFKNGNLSNINMFRNDTLHGESLFYHNNGKLHWKVLFEKGMKNGKVKYFDENGFLFQISNFKENQLHGDSKTYFPNGNMETKMFYHYGELNGKFYSYFKHGKIKTEAIYDHGKLIDFNLNDEDGLVIDHMIIYEINEADRVFEIKILNKIFDVVGITIGIEDKDGTVFNIEEKFSSDGKFNFTVPIKYRNLDKIYFRIFEMDTLKGNIEKGIVRSKIEFEHILISDK